MLHDWSRRRRKARPNLDSLPKKVRFSIFIAKLSEKAAETWLATRLWHIGAPARRRFLALGDAG